MEFGEIKASLEQELAQPINRVFSSFSENPVASASIGQVHEAYLLTGERVVVKVQRPGVGKVIETDLEIMRDVAGLLEARTVWGRFYNVAGILEIAEPFGRKLLRQKLAPENLAKAAFEYLLDLSAMSFKLPGHIDNLVQSLEQGDFKVTLEHQSFNKFITRLNLIGNRLCFSLIVASIIIGSSLIAQRSPQSLLWRFPIAEAGFIMAVFMGVWLLISIIRSGRL